MKSPLHPFAVSVAGLLCLFPFSLLSTGSTALAASSADAPRTAPVSPPVNTITIPGPLRSFLRMAGISQQVSPDEVLPFLARNVYLRGFETGGETEFLILVDRYVNQARELEGLAGANGGVIRVKDCADAVPLVHILGYQWKQTCGQKNAYLVTENPERAFLTIDSGFPLTGLEDALQKGIPFTYSYPSTQVPVMLNESDWVSLSVWRKKGVRDLLDILLHDPSVARLYWALSRNDDETRIALQRSPGFKKLLPYAAVLDFYGSQISIRSGHVLVPGGANAERSWKDLVGVSPDSPGDFVLRLLSKDDGWQAVYFDTLSRLNQAQQAHLVQAPRLKDLYEAYRVSDTGSSPTKGVFQKGSELLVLFTRLQWQPNGDPYIPGNIEIWKEILNQRTDSKVVRESSKRARNNLDTPEQLLETLVSCSHAETDTGPLQIYLTLSELDSERPADKRLADGTVRLLAAKFSLLSSWYLIFSEFPELDDTSIINFVNVAGAVGGIQSPGLRGNALGAFQANIGLWQILARQGEIPRNQMNTSWQKMIEPFGKITSSPQLFDAARSSLGEILVAASGKANRSQDEIVELLAGPVQQTPDGRRMHEELAGRIRSVLDDQRLVSLDALFELNDGLEAMKHGTPGNEHLLSLAGSLHEFEMPRPIFTESEKIDWAPMIYSSRHAELQVRTDLTKVIKSPPPPAQLEVARGRLAPFLRDTLVGLNYAYYEPPGAQVLHNNPLFVRSHDFSGITIMGSYPVWRAPELLGVGTTAGGGAYLIGSLVDLPYALAETEEDFIAPENVQALIWKEIVPDLLVSATMSRWWVVSPNELHAVALYQRFGEELLKASVTNAGLRAKVVDILSNRMAPQRLAQTESALESSAGLTAMLPRILPSDTFFLGTEFRHRFPQEAAAWSGPAGQELDALCRSNPADVNWDRLSSDFGVPHPTLARTYSRSLLNVKPFPAFGGYSSRLFGETWESSNLYWARLADEMGYSPVMLNRLVPELTRRMTAKIFATDLEDWPALLRSMQETGDEFRHGKIAFASVTSTNQEVSAGAR